MRGPYGDQPVSGAHGDQPVSGAHAGGPLLEGLIDYAGLFPPARLPMAEAAERYAAARSGPHAALLGRFLCPASQLDALAAALGDGPGAGLCDDPARGGWTVGVVFDGDWREDLERARAFAAARVDAIEVRVPDDPAALVDALPDGVTAFVEGIAPAELPPAARAKLRCGGVTADAFPGDATVAAFIRACRARDLPFKCTAGLHHPFRTRDEEIGVLQHGFVNLLAATALDVEDLEAVVAEREPEAFALGPGTISWRGHEAPAATARRLFTGYGSCSFDEPVADLIAAGALAGTASAR